MASHDETSKTTLKSLLEELEKQNIRYELTLQAAGMGFWEWELQDNIISLDKKMNELYGLIDQEEISAKSFFEIIHPEDQARQQDEIKQAVNGKKPYQSIFRIILPNKKVRYIKTVGKVIRDEQGKAIQIIGLNSNITDTIIKNNQIQKLSNELMTLFDAIPGKVIHKDKEGVFLKVNQVTADSFNLPIKEIIGKKSDSFYSEERSKKYKEEDSKVIDSKKPMLGIIEKVEHENGTISWIRTDKVPYIEKNGSVSGVVLCSFDITKEQEAKIAVDKLNDELQQFAYRTSHDLKAPLATIRSLTEIITYDVSEGEQNEALANLKKIERLSTRLSDLITDMLNLTKAELASNNEEIFHFEEEMKNIEEDLVHYLEQCPTQIRFQNKLIAPFKTEASRLRQILENLISNSIKYSDRAKETPFVEVEAREEEQKVTITIFDNGLGIPLENQKDVFGMFKRFHDIQTGSGLGLNLIKKHIDALKGHISFESNPGIGTKFTITLPKN